MTSIADLGEHLHQISDGLPTGEIVQAYDSLALGAAMLDAALAGSKHDMEPHMARALENALIAYNQLRTTQERIIEYLGAIGYGVQERQDTTASGLRETLEALRPAPYMQDKYAATEYTVRVSGGTPKGRIVRVVDINWIHIRSNVDAIAAVIKGHGCGVVAIEGPLHTRDEVENFEHDLRVLSDHRTSPEDQAKIIKKYTPNPFVDLAIALRGTDARIKLIDSPLDYPLPDMLRREAHLESTYAKAVSEYDISEARYTLRLIGHSRADTTPLRDAGMGRDTAELIKQAAETGATRPIAVVKGASHHRVMDHVQKRLPDISGTPNKEHLNLVRVRPFSHLLEPPHRETISYDDAVDVNVAFNVLSDACRQRKGDLLSYFQDLNPDKVRQLKYLLSYVESMMRDKGPTEKKINFCRQHIRRWVADKVPGRQ